MSLEKAARKARNKMKGKSDMPMPIAAMPGMDEEYKVRCAADTLMEHSKVRADRNLYAKAKKELVKRRNAISKAVEA